jgi:glycosyltransferase involved in cell wall biosynthesis
MRMMLFEISERIFAVSSYVKEELPHRFQRKISVVYNGADTELFRPIEPDAEVAAKYGVSPDTRMLLSLGMVQKRKGQEFVVEVMEKLVKPFHDVIYVNVGKTYSTSYLEDLRSQAERQVPGRVKFLSNVPIGDLVHLINLADVCVHPSMIDACPVAVTEEMSCGKPMVAFRNSAIPELIDHNENGLLVETGNLKDLTEAISSLLSDTELADKMGRNAREKVEENFTWEKAAKHVLSIYDKIL